MDFLKRLFSSEEFMPHGHCYFWNPNLLRLHIISDALITLAYLGIPIALVYIVRRRKDIPFDWIFACFGIFIVACGITHAMEIWSIWHPTYWLSGGLKAVTAGASLTTLLLLIILTPKLLAIPSPEKLRGANRALEIEVAERKRAEEAIRAKQAQIQAMQDASPLGLFFCDSAGVCHYANRVYLEITDRSLEEVAGFVWTKIVHPDDVEKLTHDWSDATSQAAPYFEAVFRYCRSDGDIIWASVNAAPVLEDGGVTGYVGTVEDITEQKRGEAELDKVHKQLLETSRQAGMAEVATGVLHNVGNVLNSVNVSATLIADGMRKSKVSNLGKVVGLLDQHAASLGTFLVNDPQGQKLPGYLRQLNERLVRDQATLLKEVELVRANIEHIKEIISMQQSYARISGVTEIVQIVDLVEDTLRMNTESFVHHDIRIVREFAGVPPVTVEKHKVLQILLNLLRNAKHACEAANRPDKQIVLRVCNGDGLVKVSVSDNGVGIPAENLMRIFNHGFTTKKDGHGFGLHSGALAAREMGGVLRAESKGPGEGATFTLELPATITNPIYV